MIRTRDFFLFLLTLFFLGILIVATIARDARPVAYHDEIDFEQTEHTPEAIAISNDIDRRANRERLRQKIAQSTHVIEPEPSVESSELVSEEVSSSTDTQIVVLRRCLASDDTLSDVPKWPFATVKTIVKNGQRIYYTQDTEEVPLYNASSSNATNTPTKTHKKIVTNTLLSLPLSPVTQNSTHCVPSEVIGVTTGGLLIFNSSVATYIGQNADTLIGYARDGYPIYGAYEGDVDECGGYQTTTGYRYTVSNNRDFILGCYRAIPQSFTL